MRDFLQGRGSLVAKLGLLALMAVSLLPAGCSQGGTVTGEVHYKMVTGMKDRVYVIIVLNEPTDGEPSIVVNAEEEIKRCFPSAGNLVVDNASEMQIEAFYTRIDYIVSIHRLSGDDYTYYEACRADREDFNKLTVGSKVKVETIPSSEGPRIVRIIG